MNWRTFVLFGTSHVMAVILCIVLIAVTIHALSLLSDRYRERALHWIRWLVVLDLVVWRGVFLAMHQFRIGGDLPLAVCSVSGILLAVYLWHPKQAIFDVLFHWILIGSSLALLIPDLVEPFPSLRFLSMFMTHGVNLFGLFFLITIRREAPSEQSASRAFRALVAYALLFALPVDRALHANYLYMLSPPRMGFSVLQLLPPWPWYWLVLMAFFYGAFHLVHATYVHYFTAAPVSSERYAE
jgi:hypothetical integral membrane protein (TIGR02206 family)